MSWLFSVYSKNSIVILFLYRKDTSKAGKDTSCHDYDRPNRKFLSQQAHNATEKVSCSHYKYGLTEIFSVSSFIFYLPLMIKMDQIRLSSGYPNSQIKENRRKHKHQNRICCHNPYLRLSA